MSDWQHMGDLLDELLLEDRWHDDGRSLAPREVHSYITRVMYNRRSKMNPLWNQIVVAGCRPKARTASAEPSVAEAAASGGSKGASGSATAAGSSADGGMETFLGVVDQIGTPYEVDFTATGLGSHMAVPMLRELWRADLSEEEAGELMEKVLRVLYYRDCRAINKVQVGTVSGEGVAIAEPKALDTKWDFKSFVKAKAGTDTGGSW